MKLKDKNIQRDWRWDVANDRVTLFKDGEAAVVVTQPMQQAPGRSKAEDKANQQFINDSYWLLFPFQLVWSNPNVEEAGWAKLPIVTEDKKFHPKFTAQWPDEGGYTPGDAYDLYTDGSGRIVQWVFRRGGGEKGRPATWDEHAQLGPIVVSLEHTNADGSFRLWFTDVSIEVEGGEEPIKPELLEPRERKTRR